MSLDEDYDQTAAADGATGSEDGCARPFIQGDMQAEKCR